MGMGTAATEAAASKAAKETVFMLEPLHCSLREVEDLGAESHDLLYSLRNQARYL
jgi:hypothetical protein